MVQVQEVSGHSAMNKGTSLAENQFLHIKKSNLAEKLYLFIYSKSNLIAEKSIY